MKLRIKQHVVFVPHETTLFTRNYQPVGKGNFLGLIHPLGNYLTLMPILVPLKPPDDVSRSNHFFISNNNEPTSHHQTT